MKRNNTRRPTQPPSPEFKLLVKVLPRVVNLVHHFRLQQRAVPTSARKERVKEPRFFLSREKLPLCLLVAAKMRGLGRTVAMSIQIQSSRVKKKTQKNGAILPVCSVQCAPWSRVVGGESCLCAGGVRRALLSVLRERNQGLCLCGSSVAFLPVQTF